MEEKCLCYTINSNTGTDEIKETHAEDFDASPAHHVRGNTNLTLRYYEKDSLTSKRFKQFSFCFIKPIGEQVCSTYAIAH